MYLKTIGVDPVVIATFIFVYLVEKDVLPVGFLPSGADAWAYLPVVLE